MQFHPFFTAPMRQPSGRRLYYYILLLNACKMNIVNFVKQFSSFFAQSGQAVSGSKNKTKNHAYQ